MERKIRTRFAPSPTGGLHMGGVRTALFAYLFAKHHGGDFLLRIEDTDQNRFVEGAEQYIIDSLAWCGIQYDEPLVRQSERKAIYKKYADQLVDSGHAYLAFDEAAELDAHRKKAEAGGTSFTYGSSNRMSLKNSLSFSKEETAEKISQGVPYVIRLKVPEREEIKFTDIIRDEVSFNSSLVDDKVLLKSDGMPTYHLAHIVDDYLMDITHAIRGEEWLSSAPAHILIYRYLGWENKMAQYAHLPLILKPDGHGKLSKRDKSGLPMFPLNWTEPRSNEFYQGYRESGYYPEAFVNMLALLGWNAGTEQEIFSMEELIRLFSLERVHKAGAKFDPEKTKWFNEQWLRKKPDALLSQELKSAVKKMYGLQDNDRRMGDDFLLQCVQLLKERVQFEQEMPLKGNYLFVAPASYDEIVITKKWKEGSRDFFQNLAVAFSSMPAFTASEVESVFKETAAKNNLKPGDVLQLFRVLLSGQGSGVDLFPMAELLGKEEVSARLQKGLSELSVRQST